MTNYENYLKEFINGSKALIKRNRLIDDSKEFNLDKNSSILFNYFNKVINQEIENQEKSQVEKKPGDKNPLFNKYWNLNHIFAIVADTNFESHKKDLKPGDKIQMLPSDFLTIAQLEKCTKKIWLLNNAKKDDEFKFMLDYDYSKKSNLIVRIREFIPDFYKFKSLQEKKPGKKSSQAEKSPIELIASLKPGDKLTKIELPLKAIMDIFSNCDKSIKLDLIDSLSKELKTLKKDLNQEIKSQDKSQDKNQVENQEKSQAEKK